MMTTAKIARCCAAVVLALCAAHAATAYPTSIERVPGDSNYPQLQRSSSSRDLDRFIEGENLLRDLELLRDRAEYFARQNRQINSLNGVGFGQNKRFDTLSGVSFGGQKRNFDEIDHLTDGFNRFVKKNFDEIDHTGGFNRFVKKNFDEIDHTDGFNRFVKKNFDKIDRTGFNTFVKKNFDEIDRSAFSSFVKRPSKVPAANFE